MLKFALSATIIALWIPGSARALHLGEHRTLTRQAITEFNFCMQDLVSQPFAEVIENANIDEDINLFRKWSTYSHFFNPRKNLEDLRRLDSSLRIVELEYEIEQALATTSPGLSEAFEGLGHAIHHFQDSATPAHVVPVMHGLSDSFESGELAPMEMPDMVLSEDICRREVTRAKKDGLLAILDETSEATLQAVEGPLKALRGGKPATLRWTAFWAPSSRNEFGTYGILGNRFGAPEIQGSDGVSYQITPKTYHAFKLKQMRLAIDATRRALHWMAARDWGSSQ